MAETRRAWASDMNEMGKSDEGKQKFLKMYDYRGTNGEMENFHFPNICICLGMAFI